MKTNPATDININEKAAAPACERILARRVARDLTAEELVKISGGRMAAGNVSFSGPGCCADDCCA